MKKILITVFITILTTVSLFAQPLTGIKNIPGDYASVKLAISSLNANGAGPGGVVFQVAADLKETFSSPDDGFISTTTGSVTNPITFVKYGAGANPRITAAPGSGDMDAIFKVAGCDYVTFDGLDILEDFKNTDPITQMEWGFAILKASGTNGSQNITVKNSKITLDFYNPAATGIYSNNHTATSLIQLTVTAESGSNSGLKFYGNTIENCYLGIYVKGFNASAPYTLYDQNNEIGKDGDNVITHFGGLDVLAYGIFASGQNNLKVANNTVTSAMDGDKNVYGIYLTSASNASYDLYGNTVSIQYSSWDGYNAGLYGIFSDMGAGGTSNTVNVYNNTVTNCSYPAAESALFYGIYVNNLGVTANGYGNVVSNNTIGSTSAGATGPIRYLWLQKVFSVAGPMVAYGNSVSGNSRLQNTNGGGTTHMLSIAGSGTTLDAYNNVVSNNAITSTGSANCLYMTFTDQNGKFVHHNTVTNITEANGSVVGLYNTNGTTVHVYNNKVQKISSSLFTTFANITGIHHATGVSVYFYNNMVSELINPAAVATLGYDYNTLSGIYVESGSVTKGFYNNTVFLNVTPTSSEYGSSAFCAANLSGVDLRNNIFVNTSLTAGSNGKTVAIRARSTSLTAYTSNYNDLYAGTPGPANLIFFNNVAADQTLAEYQARVAPNEQQSVTTLPPFVNVATSPYDLHIKSNIPTQVESGGVVMSNPIGITTDFDGNPRYPNPGYPVHPAHTPTAPDLGADEFGGLPVDLIAPNISYTPLMDINNGNPRTLVTTITDGSGVPVSGFGLPVLYWRKNGQNYLPVQGVYAGDNSYSFTFGGGAVLNDVIDYYIVAQDMVSPNPNIGAYPSQGAAGFSANPPACTVPPATPSSYKVISEISGVKHIGLGKDYTTLTAAVADLNIKYLAGPLTFILDDNTYPNETFPIKINNRPGSSSVNTLTIRPNTGANPVITGSVAGQGILVMNGIDYVTVDGSNNGTNSRNLTLENTSYTSAAHVFGITNNDGTNPSKFITVKNCVMKGAKSYNPYIDTYVFLFNRNGGINGGGYDNCTITGNELKRGKICIDITGSLNNINRNLTITNNIIGSADTNFYIQRYGIGVSQTDNTLIEGNDIMGPAQGTIFDILFGIIYYNNCSNTRIHNNKIHDWYTFGLGSYGIKCSNDNDATVTEIYNNLIYNIKCTGMNPGVSNNNSYGIFVRWGGNIRIWHNTIYLSGPYLNGFDSYAPSSSCLCFYDQSTNNFDIRNNIFRNSMTNPSSPPPGSGNMGRAFAIQFTGPVSKFSNLDYNDYFIDGYHAAMAQHWQPGYGVIAEIDSLSDWQAYTGQEAHAIKFNPQFISENDPMNLHPTNANLNCTGGPKLLDTDFDSAMRYNPTDMGAYEWANVITGFHTLPATNIAETTATLNGDINTGGEVVEAWFDFGTTANYGNAVQPVPATVRSVGNLQQVSANISGLQPNTLYHFRFWGIPKTSGQANIYGADMTFTTNGEGVPVNITVADTVSTTLCFNATNTITVAGSGSTFVVQSGGNATFIAGQKISFLPGTKVLPGGYLHGYITTNGQYCTPLDNPMVSSPVKSETPEPGNQEMAGLNCYIYPSPTEGPFTLDIRGIEIDQPARADFYSMNGVRVKTATLNGSGKHPMSVSDLKPGIYFIKVFAGAEIATIKLIKY